MYFRYHPSFFILIGNILLATWFVFGTDQALAQTPQTVMLDPSPQEEISVTNIRFEPLTKEKIKVVFSVQNSTGYFQGPIFLSVRFFNALKYDANSFKISLSTPISLRKDEEQTIESEISLPRFLSGPYDLMLFLNNHDGFEVGRNHLGTVIMSPTSEVTLSTCKLEPSQTDLSLTGETFIPWVSWQKMTQISCTAERRSKSTSREYTVSISITKKSFPGDTVFEKRLSRNFLDADKDHFAFEINPSELSLQPGDNVLRLSVNDTEGHLLSKPIHFFIEAPGFTANIKHLELDKTSYLSGESAFATLSIDSKFPPTDLHAHFELKDQHNQKCAELLNENLNEIVIEAAIPLTHDCIKPTLTVSLFQGDDILDKKILSELPITPSKHGNISSWIIISLIFVSLTFTGIIFWRRHRTKRDLPPTFPSNF